MVGVIAVRWIVFHAGSEERAIDWSRGAIHFIFCDIFASTGDEERAMEEEGGWGEWRRNKRGDGQLDSSFRAGRRFPRKRRALTKFRECDRDRR